MSDPQDDATSRVQKDLPSNPPISLWKRVIGYLKDIKEVLAAIIAIGAAIALALSYFATSKALDCFKAEARRSNELVQTILQVNDSTAAWQLTNSRLRELDLKLKDLQSAPDPVERQHVIKELSQTQSQLDDITTRLKAARERRISLEGTLKPCD